LAENFRKELLKISADVKKLKFLNADDIVIRLGSIPPDQWPTDTRRQYGDFPYKLCRHPFLLVIVVG
jgi:hypothetical protein